MSQPGESVLRAALTRLLTPLVKILLRYGVSFGEFSDLAKQVYVSVAASEAEFKPAVGRQTNTRISVLTGLTRKEVLRIQRLPEQGLDDYEKRYNRGARVVSGWINDARFRDAGGKPAALPFVGTQNSFSELVAIYSGDMSARALCDELLRIGIVRELKNGNIRLCARGYIPASDDHEKLAILGVDVGDLVSTVEHNLGRQGTDTRFQLKVSYDNISAKSAAQFQRYSDKKSMKLLQDYDRWLATRDMDFNPEIDEGGRTRVGVGIYFFEEDLDSDGEVEER